MIYYKWHQYLVKPEQLGYLISSLCCYNNCIFLSKHNLKLFQKDINLPPNTPWLSCNNTAIDAEQAVLRGAAWPQLCRRDLWWRFLIPLRLTAPRCYPGPWGNQPKSMLLWQAAGRRAVPVPACATHDCKPSPPSLLMLLHKPPAFRFSSHADKSLTHCNLILWRPLLLLVTLQHMSEKQRHRGGYTFACSLMPAWGQC